MLIKIRLHVITCTACKYAFHLCTVCTSILLTFVPRSDSILHEAGTNWFQAESTDVVQETEGSTTDLIKVGIVYITESSIN